MAYTENQLIYMGVASGMTRAQAEQWAKEQVLKQMAADGWGQTTTTAPKTTTTTTSTQNQQALRDIYALQQAGLTNQQIISLGQNVAPLMPGAPTAPTPTYSNTTSTGTAAVPNPTISTGYEERLLQSQIDYNRANLDLQAQQFELAKALGMTEADLNRWIAEEQAKYNNANLELERYLGIGNLENQESSLALQRELGLGGLDIQRDAQDLQRELGLGSLDVQRAEQELRERLGLGELDISRERMDLERLLGMEGLDLQRTLGLGGLDLERSDQALRERLGLAQQDLAEREFGLAQQLGTGDLALRRELGLGGLDLERAAQQLQRELGLRGLDEQQADRLLRERLGLGDLDLRGQQLDLEGEIARSRLGLDRDSLELQRLLGIGGLDLQREIERGRLGLDTELGRGRLDLDSELGRGQLDLSRQNLAFQQGLATGNVGGQMTLEARRDQRELARNPMNAAVYEMERRGMLPGGQNPGAQIQAGQNNEQNLFNSAIPLDTPAPQAPQAPTVGTPVGQQSPQNPPQMKTGGKVRLRDRVGGAPIPKFATGGFSKLAEAFAATAAKASQPIAKQSAGTGQFYGFNTPAEAIAFANATKDASIAQRAVLNKWGTTSGLTSTRNGQQDANNLTLIVRPDGTIAVSKNADGGQRGSTIYFQDGTSRPATQDDIDIANSQALNYARMNVSGSKGNQTPLAEFLAQAVYQGGLMNVRPEDSPYEYGQYKPEFRNWDGDAPEYEGKAAPSTGRRIAEGRASDDERRRYESAQNSNWRDKRKRKRNEYLDNFATNFDTGGLVGLNPDAAIITLREPYRGEEYSRQTMPYSGTGDPYADYKDVLAARILDRMKAFTNVPIGKPPSVREYKAPAKPSSSSSSNNGTNPQTGKPWTAQELAFFKAITENKTSEADLNKWFAAAAANDAAKAATTAKINPKTGKLWTAQELAFFEAVEKNNLTEEMLKKFFGAK